MADRDVIDAEWAELPGSTPAPSPPRQAIVVRPKPVKRKAATLAARPCFTCRKNPANAVADLYGIKIKICDSCARKARAALTVARLLGISP